MRHVSCSFCGASWNDEIVDLPNATIWCGDCDRSSLTTGAEVRYYDVQRGWRFGQVIGLHFNTDGVALATVRFADEDKALPRFQLEPIKDVCAY
jgi:hypothetical protein